MFILNFNTTSATDKYLAHNLKQNAFGRLRSKSANQTRQTGSTNTNTTFNPSFIPPGQYFSNPPSSSLFNPNFDFNQALSNRRGYFSNSNLYNPNLINQQLSSQNQPYLGNTSGNQLYSQLLQMELSSQLGNRQAEQFLGKVRRASDPAVDKLLGEHGVDSSLARLYPEYTILGTALKRQEALHNRGEAELAKLNEALKKEGRPTINYSFEDLVRMAPRKRPGFSSGHFNRLPQGLPSYVLFLSNDGRKHLYQSQGPTRVAGAIVHRFVQVGT